MEIVEQNKSKMGIYEFKLYKIPITTTVGVLFVRYYVAKLSTFASRSNMSHLDLSSYACLSLRLKSSELEWT